MGGIHRIKGASLVGVGEGHDEEAAQDAQEADDGQDEYPPVHCPLRYSPGGGTGKSSTAT